MKGINSISLVKIINKLSLIKIMKNHIQVNVEESSLLLILGDCPVGGLSDGGCLSNFLKNESSFDCFMLEDL